MGSVCSIFRGADADADAERSTSAAESSAESSAESGAEGKRAGGKRRTWVRNLRRSLTRGDFGEEKDSIELPRRRWSEADAALEGHAARNGFEGLEGLEDSGRKGDKAREAAGGAASRRRFSRFNRRKHVEGEMRTWGPLSRWAMKPLCRAGFNRRTVSYFAAQPLRLQSLCYFDLAEAPGVRGHVALTLDDAPCRGGAANSEVQTILGMLNKYGARATFMAVGLWMDESHDADLVDLLQQGHELGNHGMQDKPYHKESAAAFAEVLGTCSGKIEALQQKAGVPQGVRWFRAPHGKFTGTMAAALEERGLANVMCDTYASCPIIQDGDFIGRFLSRQAQHGSIILIHMPEKSGRQWCLTGLASLLEGLQKRGLKAVTVSELAALAGAIEQP